MTPNEQLIHHFYTCFVNKDYRGMQACYDEQAIFNDAVFKNLNTAEVKAMWEMLIRNGKNFKITFGQISGEGNRVSAHWDASYTFSATGKNVLNRIDSFFEISEGKIVKHTDQFSFYTWARQALGLSGLLLGWTSFLNRKVTAGAMRNLHHFMQKELNAIDQ